MIPSLKYIETRTFNSENHAHILTLLHLMSQDNRLAFVNTCIVPSLNLYLDILGPYTFLIPQTLYILLFILLYILLFILLISYIYLIYLIVFLISVHLMEALPCAKRVCPDTEMQPGLCASGCAKGHPMAQQRSLAECRTQRSLAWTLNPRNLMMKLLRSYSEYSYVHILFIFLMKEEGLQCESIAWHGHVRHKSVLIDHLIHLLLQPCGVHMIKAGL